jgi:hydroxyacylglutathione hydrolase
VSDQDSQIKILAFENQPYRSITYILQSAGYAKAVVIDPGNQRADRMEMHLQQHGLGIEFIALTHEHFDHIGGVERLRREYHCPVICSRDCSRAIIDPKLNMSRFWPDMEDIICKPADMHCCERKVWNWAGNEIRFFAIPGHTPGSVCIAIADHVFTGDTLLQGTKRITKLPGGNTVQWKESIRFIFRYFDRDTLIHPGHGRPFCLKDTVLSCI